MGCRIPTHRCSEASTTRCACSAGGVALVSCAILRKGSVVLFGSRVAGQYVVDTVFVVAGCIDHEAATHRELLSGKVPDAYWDVTLKPLYASGTDRRAWMCLPGEGLSWRLYFGATYENPF